MDRVHNTERPKSDGSEDILGFGGLAFFKDDWSKMEGHLRGED